MDSQAHIQVTDSGRGIDHAFLPHIFERFRQADPSTTHAGSGSKARSAGGDCAPACSHLTPWTARRLALVGACCAVAGGTFEGQFTPVDPTDRTPIEVAEIIRMFLSGGSQDWDRDDFTSIRIKDRNLDAIRLRSVAIHDGVPSR